MEKTRFRHIDAPQLSIASEDNKLRIGRSVNSAPPNKAFYHVAWNGEHKARGTVLAREAKSSSPSTLSTHFEFEDLQRLVFRGALLAADEEAEFLRMFLTAVCELHQDRLGPFAEALRTKLTAHVSMPDGTSRAFSAESNAE